MKYLVCSDIHGSLPALEKLLEHYETMQCDQLLFIGDLLNYGPRNRIPEGINPQGIVQIKWIGLFSNFSLEVG